jgi:hypothetical protein
MSAPAVSWRVFGRSVAPISIHVHRGSAENSADLLREREPRQRFRVLRVTSWQSPTDTDARYAREGK